MNRGGAYRDGHQMIEIGLDPLDNIHTAPNLESDLTCV